MLQPVNISPPEVLIKACSDGKRVGLQLANVPGLNRPLAAYGAWWSGQRRMWLLEASDAEHVVQTLEDAYLGQYVDLHGADVTV